MRLPLRPLIGLSAALVPVALVLGSTIATQPRAEATAQAAKICPETLKAQKLKLPVAAQRPA
jgi:hypothetical protein